MTASLSSKSSSSYAEITDPSIKGGVTSISIISGVWLRLGGAAWSPAASSSSSKKNSSISLLGYMTEPASEKPVGLLGLTPFLTITAFFSYVFIFFKS
jgi:hypothetical protein